jgi:DNA-binding NtrC family response regulator
MSLRTTVLVVDHDEKSRQLLESHLQECCAVLTVADATQATDVLAHTAIDALLIDVRSTDVVRLQPIDALRRCAGDVPVVLLAGLQPDNDGAGEATDNTSAVLIGKPMALSEVARALEDATTERRLSQEILKRQTVRDDTSGIIAESSVMRSVIGLIDRAAQSDTPVLLIGESGTGKELLARALHARSPRARGPFVAVNCSAIPETLLENELFGHRLGAFTDAREDQRGLFQTAGHGTIFLDEIGDMAPSIQGKLLRVLQEKEVHPLGAPAPVPVDVRIVAATHRDLDAQIAAGLFRQDLLYRINVVDIRIPPLRERPDDLMPLIAHFLEKHSARCARPRATVSATAMEQLRRHSWPGNARELENAIERALVLGSGGTIRIDDLPEALRISPAVCPDRRVSRPLVAVEREHILKTLRSVDGNKSAAARALGLDRKTLYRKLRRGSAPR